MKKILILSLCLWSILAYGQNISSGEQNNSNGLYKFKQVECFIYDDKINTQIDYKLVQDTAEVNKDDIYLSNTILEATVYNGTLRNCILGDRVYYKVDDWVYLQPVIIEKESEIEDITNAENHGLFKQLPTYDLMIKENSLIITSHFYYSRSKAPFFVKAKLVTTLIKEEQ